MSHDHGSGPMSSNRPIGRRRLAQWLATAPLMLAGCARSEAPAAAGLPAHHTADGFRNPPGSPTRGGDRGDWAGFFYRRLIAPRATPTPPPGHVLDAAEVAAGLSAASGSDSLTWLGHAALLLRLGGTTVLTDPFLTSHASPVPPFGPRRYAPPGLAPADLPPIDVVLLSHNHYEHLDLATLRALVGRERITVVVPLGLVPLVEPLGFAHVVEVDWHDRHEIAGLSVTALPAIHFSGRGLFDRNRTLWTGYLLEAGGRKVLFAGDTAYGPVFDELGRRYGALDLAAVPIGAYAPREMMRAAHTTPEEAVALGRDLGAGRLMAMHWGTIQLSDEPPFEPPERFRIAAARAGYDDDAAWVMAIGETRRL